MFAKTHITIGMITAATAALLVPRFNTDGLKTLQALALMPAGALVTSQLPDMDSVHSKVAQKIPLFKLLTSNRFSILLFLYSAVALTYDYIQIEKFMKRNYIIFYSAILCALLLILCLMFRKVFTHRKLTHTLLFNAFISAFLLLPYYMLIHTEWYLMLAIGGIVGLLSHLFYDCLTIRGCPLFSPFSNKNIRFLSLKSGRHDYIGVCLSLLFLLSAVCIVIYKENIVMFYKTLL